MSLAQAAVSNTHTARYLAVGLASGALVMTGFGTLWVFAGVGILGMPGIGGALSLVGVGLVAVVLFLVGIALLRAALRLPRDTSPESKARGAAIGRRYGIVFGIVFGIEFLSIGVASTICSLLNHPEFIIPLTVLIIGLHFLPLAALFKVSQYYLTGILLSLIAVITMISVPSTTTIGQGHIWDVLPSFASGLVLWLTAVSVLITGRNEVVKASGSAEATK